MRASMSHNSIGGHNALTRLHSNIETGGHDNHDNVWHDNSAPVTPVLTYRPQSKSNSTADHKTILSIDMDSSIPLLSYNKENSVV